MHEFAADPTSALPYAFGEPPLSGVSRASPEDFQVEEMLGYTASGAGEHVLLQVRKRLLNTADVARELARFAGVRQVNVGFAGLKDRNAVTTQTFSVQLPGRADPDWDQLNDERLQILSAQRHDRKVRRGRLRGNRFSLVLRELQGDSEAAQTRLTAIQAQGVPNYFGAQRFGRGASNLQRAEQWLSGQGRRPKPEQLRMLYSAARAYLFNQVAAARVSQGSWQKALPGEVLLLAGSERQFQVERQDQELNERLASGDIHPSGPLPGDIGRCLQATLQASEVEQQALADPLAQSWCQALAERRVDADRRALRLLAEDLQWNWIDAATLQVSFSLVSGGFATAVLRELMQERLLV